MRTIANKWIASASAGLAVMAGAAFSAEAASRRSLDNLCPAANNFGFQTAVGQSGGRSKRAIVKCAGRARQELARVGAKIFGVALNNVDLEREGCDDYYYSRYHSDYDNGKKAKAAGAGGA